MIGRAYSLDQNFILSSSSLLPSDRDAIVLTSDGLSLGQGLLRVAACRTALEAKQSHRRFFCALRGLARSVTTQHQTCCNPVNDRQSVLVHPKIHRFRRF
jgi:hypothetical protein